ncbi:MAG: MBL fold metallo-hydrolase [Candidatus Caldarchaeales archaeon]
MEIKFLGGAQEVGRSAILVKTREARILLDYGVQVSDPEPSFPSHVAAKDLDAVILTHAHLDHIGAAPLFMLNNGTKIFATPMTFKIADILLRDFLKLAGYYLPYEILEVREMIRKGIEVSYGDTVKIKDAEITFMDAGHIPGSMQVLINADKTLLYTGDFTTIKTRLLSGADLTLKDLDAVIVESTYALEDHPERKNLEREFVARVREVVENGGRVLIPAFSVSRSQEIMCVLEAYNFRYPVYLDGMAIKILDIYLEMDEYIDGRQLLYQAARHINRVTSGRKRKQALSEPSAIISPAGMLKGGPAIIYSEELAEDEKSAIFLVSFQLPNTPGATLLNERRLVHGEIDIKVKAQVGQYKFSSHAGRTQLHEFLKRLGPDVKIFTVHGEPAASNALVDFCKSSLGQEAISPIREEIYTI